jgi:uncharacterized delta-60 repeat protein
MLSPFMSIAPRFLRVARCWSVLGAVLSAVIAGFAQSAVPSAVDGYDPNVDGNVYAVMAQTDGKIIIAGQFAAVRPGVGPSATRNNLARLNPDGSVDTTFDPNANGPVRVVVPQADGKILIGGDFTALQPNGAAAPVSRSGIARLNTDGTLDTTFAPVVTNSLQIGSSTVAIGPQIYALVVQLDGRIVVGGAFTGVGGVTRNRMARLNASGALDTTFNPNADNTVFALALHTGGKIVVAGGFTQFQPNGATVATTRNYLARLNVDGTVDTAADPSTGNQFDPNANNRALTLAVQRDGLILVGGDFTAMQPAGTGTAVIRSHLARLNTDGTLDPTFNANAAASVITVGIQPDGRLLVGGAFNSVWSNGGAVANIRFLARFNPDGTVDQGFNSGVNNAVAAFAFQPDGQLVIGGYFTGFVPNGSSNSTVRNRVARLNPVDGALDATLNLDAGGRILVSAVQPTDGKILIGGSFTSVGGATHTRLARLNTDGSVDPTFNPDFNERVFAIAPLANGKILVGGGFTTISGVTRNFIARLNSDGSVDTTVNATTGYAFDPNASSQVGAIVVQPDGKILLAGAFTTFTPAAATPTSLTRFYIARLNTDGTVDTAFDPNANSTIAAVALLPDGKILVGGTFTAFQPNGATVQTGRNRIARLNADGTVDGNFNVSVDDQVSLIAMQPDGKAVIAGIFSVIRATGADQVLPRLRIARLNADGTLDTAFDPAANAAIATLALQSDGKILVGGPFTTFDPNGTPGYSLRKYAARLNADGTVDSTFNLDLNEQNGNRVDSITVQPDGRILVAGTFVSLQPIGATSRVSRVHFARITAAGGLDATFQPGVGGNAGGQIKALAVQTDGKIVAAGVFSDVGGTTTTNIARFNPTGTADTGFEPTLSANGAVNALLLRPDAAPSVVQGQGIAWLNANGTVRTAFSPDTNSRINGVVDALVRQADGNILVGGAFATTTGLPGSNLVRFTPAGVIDQTFAPSPNGGVGTIVVQPDGRLLVAGSFTTIGGISRNFIARLNSDGSTDSVFNPNPNARVNAIVLQPDGKILIGGAFTSLTPNNAATATTAGYVARLNSDGSLDTTFAPNVGGAVTSLLLQADGQVVIGGSFTLVTPAGATTSTLRNRIARVSAAGVLDTNFDPNFNDIVNTLALAADGKIVVGGNFTNVNPNTVTTTVTSSLGVVTSTTSTTATTRNHLARLNTDGTLDGNFDPNTNSTVSNVAIQANGQILIAGTFTTLQPNGASLTTTRNHVARLNADGTLDTNFNPNANNSVNVVTALPDGTILAGGFFTALQPNVALLVGGAFTTIDSVTSQYIALLNNDGSVSTSFQPNPNNVVNALLAQPDGKIVAGGAFTNIAGVTRNRLARFNADSNTTLDTGFNPAINGTVNVMAIQPDGKIVIGGVFTTVNGQTRNAIARLNPDGTLDAAFVSSAFLSSNFGVTSLAVQPDGRLLAVGPVTINSAGSFALGRLVRLNADGSTDTTFTSAGPGPVSAIVLQSDGRILSGTFLSFSTDVIPSTNCLVRLNTDGTIDPSFNSGVAGTGVTAIALQADGRPIIGGLFSSVGGLPRSGLARLSVTTPAAQSLAVSRTTVLWTRTGGGPELAAATFEQSADSQTWTPLGQAGRVTGTGNWQLGGLTLPASGLFYIRARGLVPASSGTSASTLQYVRQFNLAAVAGVGPADLTSPTLAADDTTHVAVGSIAALPKVSGAASEVASDIYLPASRNTFDQVLLAGTSATVTADPGQVTRLSFVDLTNDIVQVEFSGAGALSIYLDNASGPATAVSYNQPDVAYMKGHAGIVITGADETTNVSIYSVGRLTAINQTLFKSDVKYDGVADIGYLTIQSANGKFGGVRTANASYVAVQGVAGIRAPGVQFTGPVYVGDINAADTATPMLLLGLANDVRIAGGDLWQANGQPVQVSGIAQLKFTDGMTSGGALLPAQADQSRLEQNGADVTAQVVVNPSP